MSSYDPDYLEEMDRRSVQAFEDMVEERTFFQDAIVKLITEEYLKEYKEEEQWYVDEAFHLSIWNASTIILNGLEVQVVVDGDDKLHISYGTAGFVSFLENPVGLKLPVKCWIHTHPFGAAYFSGTDWNTVSIWKPLMQSAYVLGGPEHFGHWEQDTPNELCIHKDGLYTIQYKNGSEEE